MSIIVDKHNYNFRRKKVNLSKPKLLVALTIITTLIYLLWRSFFTLPLGHGKIAMLLGCVLLLSEIFGMFEQMIHFKNMTVLSYPKKPDVTGMDYPTVDVFIATYNEPVELLFKTVNACTNMVYPEMENVQIYLCDDGNRKEVKRLAKKFKVNYLARKDHSGAKAGNLNHALAHSKGELIVTFDADMIPRSNFLMECVPYFMHDLQRAELLEQNDGKEARRNRKGKIGFVQTPQSFYNLDLFQYNLYSEENIPNEQDYFYRDIQLAKNRTNSVIYGGSNTVISREALEEIGGFVTNVITEDFATGMLIQSKGYRCFAIDKVLASGLSPEDLESLVKQRRRWARGCIQTGRKWSIVRREGLSVQQKISYMVSIAYWYDSIKRFIYVLAPIMYSVFGITIFKADPLELLVFWLPMYWLNSTTIKYLSGNIRTLQWTNIYETIMFPLLLKDVCLEILGISQTKFSVTRKGNAKEDKGYQFKMAIPHIILTALTLIGAARTIYVIFATGNVGISFLLFWLIVNLYNLTMALFFMIGRKSFRKSERFHISADCTIQAEHELIQVKTYDISEGGFSILMDTPHFMEPENEMKIILTEQGYRAVAYGKIIQVMRSESGWKYAFQITRIGEQDYRQLLHILHDRVPPLTREVRENIGFYDNIKTNVLKRTIQHNSHFNRKLPRVMMSQETKDEVGERITVQSFDYWYVSLAVDSWREVKRMRTVQLGNEVELLLEYDRDLSYGREKNQVSQKVLLYKIVNRQEVMENPRTMHILMELDQMHQEAIRKTKEKRKAQGTVEFDELALL